jgi:glutathione S-transferase
MAIRLYDAQRSPNARKVRLLAAELDIPLERVPLDFVKGELRTHEYLAKNPNGKVPTLEDDGFLIWESAAILRYLAEKRPERGLMPSDPKRRALVDQWLFWWTSHPEAALLNLVVERLVKPFLGQPGNDPSIVGAATAELERFLPILDARLSDREFIVDDLSIVDFAIAPWLESAQRLDVPVERFTHVSRWLGRMQAKPYWADA